MLHLLAEAVQTELMIGNEFLQLAVAICLILVAAALLFAELIIVSGGLLGLLAACSAGVGCYLAYEIGPGAFYSALALTPIVGVITIRYGLKRLSQSNMVSQVSIDGDAGYESVAAERGVEVGSIGSLETDAMPTGRARFEKGEVDVILKSGAGSTGDKVKVIEIDGPSIYVIIPKDA